jgi:hypothetical protein
MARKKKSHYIDGIFNYCDRWCERCAFTERCRQYEMEQAAFSTPESRDVDNAEFWEALSGVFEQTRQMLYDSAAEHGIDLNAIELGDDTSQRRLEQVWHSTLSRLGQDYAGEVDTWFKAHERLFAECEQALNQRLRMELDGDQPEAEAVALADAAEVIQWYQYQIAVKLMRALTDEGDAEEEADDDDARATHEYDRDGSAKVALIGIDRSLAAWTVLRQSLADESDTILDILLRLSRLRVAAERAFPDARAFVRPGFDAPV